MISQIIDKAIEFNKGDPRRISHFLKVYSFAKTIGELEKIDGNKMDILEISAVLHDIGIHVCEKNIIQPQGICKRLKDRQLLKKCLMNLIFFKKL